MSFKLRRLIVTGTGKPAAEIDLTKPGTVIFGPSETGKSYVFQCITYCLGGDTLPEEIPEAQGYQSVFLELQAGPGSGMVDDEPDIQSSLGFDDPSPHSVDRDIFTVVRAIQGGSEAIYRAEIEAVPTARRLKIDCNELITRLVGVSGNVVFKKAGTKGSLSAGPLRHWSLLSQTSIVARDNVLGDSNARTERSAALALMLTGVDDTAIETGVSTEEKRNAAGGADAIRGMITSLKADIPPETTKKDLDETLARVDETLAALSQQQKSRAQGLATVRGEIASVSAQFRKCEGELAQSIGLVSRFKLLEQKYQSDLERLASLSEGAAVYELLATLPCPLCGTNLEHHAKDSATSANSADSTNRQRRALAAEAAKIEKQQSGLGAALLYESERLTYLKARRNDLGAALERHSVREQRMIHSGIAEFEVSATDLARQRSELSTQVRAFKEIARLTSEAARLQAISATKNSRVERQLAQDGLALSALTLDLIQAWGFDTVKQVTFDAALFDIRVDGRKRTSFGQGVRALFLAAFYVALLQHAHIAGRPHPGFVVIDSPLKSYADRKQDDPNVPKATVKACLYSWLAEWTGPGQLVMLENEEPPAELLDFLKPSEFTKQEGVGRRGFFP